MKTILRIIWIPFLIIGLMVGCSKEIDNVNITTYNYKNLSTNDIIIDLLDINSNLYQSIIIKPNENYQIIFEAEGKGVLPPFWFDYGTKSPSKAIIKFTDNKCLTYNINEGILNKNNYDNYNSNMENNYKNNLEFIFDQTEIDLASNCN